MNKKALVTLAGTAILALSLSGCIPTSHGTKNLPDDSSEVVVETPAPSFAPEAEEDAPSENLAFGDAMTWEDDVSLSVSVPGVFTPSEYAAGADQPGNIQFNITITNNSSVNLNPTVYGRMSSGGVESSQIFDTELSGSPSTVVLPGGTITWTEAWSVTDPANLIYQVSPSYDYEDAIFVLGN